MAKVKIILDADVLIHFAKAGRLNMLPEILPEYEHVVLSTVYDEIGSIQNQLDNQIFCYTHNVIGSSTLKDIREYCEKQQITYLTTIDFLYYGIKRGKMSVEECEQFVKDVLAKGSKLPTVDFGKYLPNALI